MTWAEFIDIFHKKHNSHYYGKKEKKKTYSKQKNKNGQLLPPWEHAEKMHLDERIPDHTLTSMYVL